MTAFSWVENRQKVLKMKIKRELNKAKLSNNPSQPGGSYGVDFKKAHPDESRDENNNKTTLLKKRITDKFNDRISNHQKRMEKNKK